MEDREKTPRRSVRRSFGVAVQGLQLLLIQSSICVIVILITLCLRWIGSDLFHDVSVLFRQAMLDDTLVSAVVSSFETETVSAMAYQNEEPTCAETMTPPLVGGVVTSSFGERDGSFHEGVDIAAEEGTPLRALLSGTVTTVGYEEKGYGNYVVVSCSATEKYLYAHCSKIFVKEGDAVTKGDTIAAVGSTGRSSGNHLHIEWLCDGEPIDPMTVLPKETYA